MKMLAGLIGLVMVVFVNPSIATLENRRNQQQDRPVRIKSKPAPSMNGCKETRAVIQLRITFGKSAEVTDVEITKSSGCENFDKSVLSVSRRIKFDPAIKNGEAITVTKMMEYSFSTY